MCAIAIATTINQHEVPHSYDNQRLVHDTNKLKQVPTSGIHDCSIQQQLVNCQSTYFYQNRYHQSGVKLYVNRFKQKATSPLLERNGSTIYQEQNHKLSS
jgi:hypothetical protein